jgi:polar amino acid transport system substrate-binding protein
MKNWIAALAAVAVLASCAPETKKVVFATDSTWPPMEYINEAQELVGYDIDLVKEIAKEGGFEVEFKSVAWDGIFAGLENGAYDAVVSSVTITDERKAQYDFSDPYINAGQILVVPVASTATQLADLAGQPVGAQIGTTGAIEIEKFFGSAETLKSYDEIGLAFEDLANGRIAGVVTDTPVAAQFALQNEKYKTALKIVGESMTEEFYGIVVKKGNQALLDKINAGLAKVKAAGTPDKLAETWLK